MNKYYTPDIEEFYVGFEYEIQQQEMLYGECIYSDLYALFNYKIGDHINLNHIRVKYLDQKDIESLGFKFQSSEKFGMIDTKTFIKNSQDSYFKLTLLGNEGQIEINSIYNNIDIGRLFLIIKNKSELKKLLKQLGIE